MSTDAFWGNEADRKQLVQDLLRTFKVTRMIKFPEMSPEWCDEGLDELKVLTEHYIEFYGVLSTADDCPSYFDAAKRAAGALGCGESLEVLLMHFNNMVTNNKVTVLQNIDEMIERLESKRSKYINTLRSGGLILTVSTDRLHADEYHFMHAIIACQLFKDMKGSEHQLKKLSREDGDSV